MTAIKKLAIAGVVVAAAAAAGGYYLTFGFGTGDRFASCRAGAVAGGAGAIGGPFTLVSETGETVTDAEVITRPTLLYFGYTFCPDVCPLDTVRNADATDLLTAQGYDAQSVFITVDPDRDTPERMAEFTDFIHPDMIGLTGSDAQVRAAVQAYKAYFNRHNDDPDYYLVDHSTFTYLVLPGHGFVEFFRREATPSQMAEGTACYLDAM